MSVPTAVVGLGVLSVVAAGVMAPQLFQQRFRQVVACFPKPKPKPTPSWVQVETPAEPRRTKAGRPLIGTLVLFVVGGLLLLVAFLKNVALDADDLNRVKRDNARFDVDRSLERYAGRPAGYLGVRQETKPADRTPVYILASLGAVFIGMGVICFVIETRFLMEETRRQGEL